MFQERMFQERMFQERMYQRPMYQRRMYQRRCIRGVCIKTVEISKCQRMHQIEFSSNYVYQIKNECINNICISIGCSYNKTNCHSSK